jgi:hypothetical protein
MTKERAALEATRARLEAALSTDANWRALRRSRGQANGDQSDESRASDARLELLLLANPLFRAWKHVDDAIEDLGKTEADAGAPGGRRTLASALPSLGPNAPKQIASLADLSQGIARLLERNLPDVGPDPRPARANGEVHEAPPPEEPSETGSASLVALAAGPEAEVDAEAEVEIGPAAAQAAEAASAIDAMPSAPPPAAEPRKAASAPPAGLPWMVSGRARAAAPVDFSVDVEEATVTFVTRGPPAARRPAGSVAGPERQQARGHDATGAASGSETLYPLGGDIEEAEVTILSDKDIGERQQAAKRDGNLRRFRKALKGD